VSWNSEWEVIILFICFRCLKLSCIPPRPSVQRLLGHSRDLNRQDPLDKLYEEVTSNCIKYRSYFGR
jgi:hypothetical protein